MLGKIGALNIEKEYYFNSITTNSTVLSLTYLDQEMNNKTILKTENVGTSMLKPEEIYEFDNRPLSTNELVPSILPYLKNRYKSYKYRTGNNQRKIRKKNRLVRGN